MVLLVSHSNELPCYMATTHSVSQFPVKQPKTLYDLLRHPFWPNFMYLRFINLHKAWPFGRSRPATVLTKPQHLSMALTNIKTVTVVLNQKVIISFLFFFFSTFSSLYNQK